MMFSKSNTNRPFRPHSEQPSAFLFVSLIALISFVAYFNSLFNGFVFDDTFQVLNNPWLKSPKFIPNIFASNVWGFEGRETSYYRPLMHIIYMITASIFGFHPWGFHFVNILFHTGVSILVFLIASKVFKQYDFSGSPFFLFPPFMAAILFSVHPIHTEAVAWIGGIPDLSYTFFSLASFYLYLRASDNTATSFNLSYLLAVALFFLATLCKEPALILPIILVSYDFTVKTEKMALTVYLKKYSLYIIVVIIYFAMRVHALKGFAPVKEHTELNHVITLFPLFTNYLQKLLLPLNLSVCYVIKPIDSIFEPGSVISLLVALAFLFLFFYSFTKSKTVFFVLSCLVGPLMPSLYIPALGKSGIFAERYLYLPSFGFVMLLSFLIPYGLSKRVSTKVLSLFFLLLMVLYSIGTIYRNNVWKDNYTLWTDTIRKAADAALPHFNLGNELRSQGRIGEAIEQYQISLRLEPTKAEAHDNLGVAYVMKGEFDKAVAEFQIALKLNPFSANAYNNLGTTYAKMGFLDKAIEYYKMAIALKPDDVRYQKHLSEACEKKKASDANVRK